MISDEGDHIRTGRLILEWRATTEEKQRRAVEIFELKFETLCKSYGGSFYRAIKQGVRGLKERLFPPFDLFDEHWTIAPVFFGLLIFKMKPYPLVSILYFICSPIVRRMESPAAFKLPGFSGFGYVSGG